MESLLEQRAIHSKKLQNFSFFKRKDTDIRDNHAFASQVLEPISTISGSTKHFFGNNQLAEKALAKLRKDKNNASNITSLRKL